MFFFQGTHTRSPPPPQLFFGMSCNLGGALRDIPKKRLRRRLRMMLPAHGASHNVTHNIASHLMFDYEPICYIMSELCYQGKDWCWRYIKTISYKVIQKPNHRPVVIYNSLLRKHSLGLSRNLPPPWRGRRMRDKPKECLRRRLVVILLKHSTPVVLR